MRDSKGRVIEGSQSNLFLIEHGRVLTPDLSRCGIRGVMRDLIMESASELGLAVTEEDIDLERLMDADALFLSNSLIGIWPVGQCAEKMFNPGAIPSPLVDRVMELGFRG